jgi:hypothetical protein
MNGMNESISDEFVQVVDVRVAVSSDYMIDGLGIYLSINTTGLVGTCN